MVYDRDVRVVASRAYCSRPPPAPTLTPHEPTTAESSVSFSTRPTAPSSPRRLVHLGRWGGVCFLYRPRVPYLRFITHVRIRIYVSSSYFPQTYIRTDGAAGWRSINNADAASPPHAFTSFSLAPVHARYNGRSNEPSAATDEGGRRARAKTKKIKHGFRSNSAKTNHHRAAARACGAVRV